jgi:exopolysaccharide biosynthesis polyprenyl glycosylphosphotransferase
MSVDHDLRVRAGNVVPIDRRAELVVLPGLPPRWLGGLRFAGDLIGLALALATALALHSTLAGSSVEGRTVALLIPTWFVVHVLALNHVGLYRERVTRTAADEVPQVIRGAIYGTIVIIALSTMSPFQVPQPAVTLAMAATAIAITTFRGIATMIERNLRGSTKTGVRTIVVGQGSLARRTVSEIYKHPEEGLRVVGTVGYESLAGPDSPPHLGTVATLSHVVETMKIRQVIVALEGDADESVVGAIWSTAGSDARVSLVVSHPDFVLPFGEHDRLGSLPLIHVRSSAARPVARAVRAVFDWSAALVLLTVSLPMLGALALWIRRDSDGPAFFRQVRVGKNGKHFKMIKLRTMVHDAEAQKDLLRQSNEGHGPLFKLREDPRVTRPGRWLRRTSIDELPQLWNVVKGQMSLIGPRPPTPDEVAMYPGWFRRRLAVRPGITGLWQVSGRSDLSFAEAMRMDLTYVEAWSPWLDVQILLRTATAVLRRDGAY